jgi:hypothetical protein
VGPVALAFVAEVIVRIHVLLPATAVEQRVLPHPNNQLLPKEDDEEEEEEEDLATRGTLPTETE